MCSVVSISRLLIRAQSLGVLLVIVNLQYVNRSNGTFPTVSKVSVLSKNRDLSDHFSKMIGPERI